MKKARISLFPTGKTNHMDEHMFMGTPINVARYDESSEPIFLKLIEKQHSFFWRPEEVDLSKDRVDFESFTDAERHIFLSNLKYQSLLDSGQGRGPSLAFLPLASIPALETWIETWSFSETIHSLSYTHMVRTVMNMPEEVFDDIPTNPEIIKRAEAVSKEYDRLIHMSNIFNTLGEGTYTVSGEELVITTRELKKQLYVCMMSVNILEGVRFYVSFACTFAFCEREKIEGSAKIMKLIARDEQLHLSSTQHILNKWADGKDDPEMAEIAIQCFQKSIDMFIDATNQEKDWAKYLFKDGSMIGLNEEILCQYIEFIANVRMRALKLPEQFNIKSNPIPWVNTYLQSDNVQVAPQETEISSYLVGQIDASVSIDDFDDFQDL
jgi:ribonucleoside-diphosphate reductase beta chain